MIQMIARVLVIKVIARVLTCSDKDVNVVGLRRWRKGFFNIAPFSGDTFFQLENIGSKTNKGI